MDLPVPPYEVGQVKGAVAVSLSIQPNTRQLEEGRGAGEGSGGAGDGTLGGREGSDVTREEYSTLQVPPGAALCPPAGQVHLTPGH